MRIRSITTGAAAEVCGVPKMLIVALLLSSIGLINSAHAEQPPFSFDEEITLLSGSTTSIHLKQFDPISEDSVRLFTITSFPKNLQSFGGRAGAQSCAFGGICAFLVDNFVGRRELAFRVFSSRNRAPDPVPSLPVIVSIDVVETIEAPIAFPQTAATVSGAELPLQLGGVAPQSAAINFEVETAPTFGSLNAPQSGAGDLFTYTPEAGFSGLDEFTFTVSDGIGVSDAATVKINELAEDAPIIVDLSQTAGSTNGGQIVGISGINFVTGAAEVLFGETFASEVEVTDSETLIAVTPANIAGAVDVRVVTPIGESVFRSGFTFSTPDLRAVAAVLPSSRSVEVGVDATVFATIVNAGMIYLGIACSRLQPRSMQVLNFRRLIRSTIV